MTSFEINFDGLVGPTHNYAGLSYGNVASFSNASTVSSPRTAALQGLAKMKQLADLGIRQAVLPPHERPAVETLRLLGFTGSDSDVLAAAFRDTPRIFRACCSASAMWTANAATVSPSADSGDGRVHFTPANLANRFHRAIEAPVTARVLKAVFPDPDCFAHHDPLPSGDQFSDEGAANHTRLCREYGEPGVELFVFGRYAFDETKASPAKFPARQTFEASAAIARRHRLAPERVVYAQQNPAAIDTGVFHNDVIAVGNGNVLFYHERAFIDSKKLVEQLQTRFDGELCFIEVPEQKVTLLEAVQTYLFNSQLLSRADGSMTLVVPDECRQHNGVSGYLDSLVTDSGNPIGDIITIDVRESMRNGGGPACLRLRVVLSEDQIARTNPAVLLDDALYGRLKVWIERWYRDRLSIDDLVDPQLLDESRSALDELSQLLKLGPVYPFQRG